MIGTAGMYVLIFVLFYLSYQCQCLWTNIFAVVVGPNSSVRVARIRVAVSPRTHRIPLFVLQLAVESWVG